MAEGTYYARHNGVVGLCETSTPLSRHRLVVWVGLRWASHCPICLQVKELETDNANMRQFGKEKQNQVVMLEQKVASLETVVDDMTRRAKDLAAENARVASERDALAENVKKLTRDLKRLGAVRQPQPSQLGAWTDSVGAV